MENSQLLRFNRIMTLAIDFRKNDDLRREITSPDPPSLITADFEIRTDQGSVFEDIASRGVWSDFFHTFLKATLSAVPDLAEGRGYSHPLEGPFAVEFEPTDSSVAISLEADPTAADVLSGTRHQVPFDDFVSELVETAAEFHEFVLEVDESLEDHQDMVELREAIREAETYVE